MSRLAEAPFFVGRELRQQRLHLRPALIQRRGEAVTVSSVEEMLTTSQAAELLVIRIRGSKGSSHQAFRPVNFLLSELEADVVDHPVMVLQAVAELLNFQARGRRVVLAAGAEGTSA